MVPNDPKWSQMIQNGPKFPQMVPNGPKWSLMVPNEHRDLLCVLVTSSVKTFFLIQREWNFFERLTIRYLDC